MWYDSRREAQESPVPRQKTNDISAKGMVTMDYLTMTIGKQKNIALIAHDQKKRELIDWCNAHKEVLKHHFLCGTGTTARTHNFRKHEKIQEKLQKVLDIWRLDSYNI